MLQLLIVSLSRRILQATQKLDSFIKGCFPSDQYAQWGIIKGDSDLIMKSSGGWVYILGDKLNNEQKEYLSLIIKRNRYRFLHPSIKTDKRFLRFWAH